MKLLFLDSAVLFAWALHLVFEKTGRRLELGGDRAAGAVAGTIESYGQVGLRASSTIGSAAEVVTKLFKGSALPFKGDCRGFQVRKSIARVAGELLRDRSLLLAPAIDHFVEAERLWLAWCDDEAKESYAQFSDYIDAALILNPPEGTAVTDAMLGHEHVSYILRKERSSVRPFILRVDV